VTEIDIKDHMDHRGKEDPVFWALCELIGDKYKECGLAEGQSVYNVEVKINGIEVDFKKMCVTLHNGYAENVKREAIELLKNHLGDVTNKFSGCPMKSNVERVRISTYTNADSKI
jgi:hypothetical protein